MSGILSFKLSQTERIEQPGQCKEMQIICNMNILVQFNSDHYGTLSLRAVCDRVQSEINLICQG